MDRRLFLSVGMFTSGTELLMDACGDESTTHNLDSNVVEDIWKETGKSIGNTFKHFNVPYFEYLDGNNLGWGFVLSIRI